LDILGVSLKTTKQDDIEVVESLLELLVDIRGDLRKMEDYAISDKIRTKLINLGFVLEDTPTGTTWKRN
jgi:cysteinyl-tRNA synthetase